MQDEDSVERVPGPSKKCNCRNSKCVKLYCECYQANVFCDPSCHCLNCYNNATNNNHRKLAVQSTLEKNPTAFQPKILHSDSKPDPLNLGKHQRGCACKKSGCMKKYCECFQAKVPCSDNCKCHDCRNHGCFTKDQFSKKKDDDNILCILFVNLDSLLLAKDHDHLQSIIGSKRKEIFDQKSIDSMCDQMRKIIKQNPEEQIPEVIEDDFEKVLLKNQLKNQVQENKIKGILDVFITTLKKFK